MLSPEKRQLIEREGAREIQRFHREIHPTTLASIIDDIRHKVVEEGWFGRQVTGDMATTRLSTDVTCEHSDETSLHRAVYGEDAAGWNGPDNAQQDGRDIHGNPIGPSSPDSSAIDPERVRREPEAGL